ncbi:hypothetical protein NADFUDRAFT_59346 [Nadsonia fulvescens var. elongata DSM 6958]|uniref:Uncharacterized protein n=1 Tax=Nadsonia fulvescens var. elongata DSM 6958 TaxID=857566 RepID=A0A1E3PIM2_9ASCO|nr:hypothetical protein NADFUDRAFT_59346 [Nadsonia fulvescens var. elongata DSM 6958]
MAPKPEKKGKTGTKKVYPNREPVTTDPRFSGIHNDPRFNLPKTRDSKVSIDDRFKSKLKTDKDFKKKLSIDKYGRKIVIDKAAKEMEKYYNLNDKEDSGSEEGSEDESDGEGQALLDRARGDGASESDSEEDSDSDSSDSEGEISEEDGFTIESSETIPQGDETNTLAVVNLDWDNVTSVDLMAAFSSFVPTKGRILSVKVLPSEYGKEKMADEAINGPARELFEDKKKKKKNGNNSDNEEINEKTIIQEDKGEEVDGSRFRKYQLQRLRYYYAVVKCDSVHTAKNIYDNVDGTEYESTANFFDLRYVPEDMTFDDEPRDECTKIHANYKPNVFVTDALQHSKVKLTWDETPVERAKMASRAFSQREIDDMDFKAYLASDSEESSDEVESKTSLKNKYRAMLSETGIQFGEDADREDKDDVDMEITFTPGLEDEAKKADENDKEESTIEKYRRKERERRQKRLNKMKESKNKDSGDLIGEGEESDPETASKQKEKRKQKKNAATEDESKRAELELLMMDDEDNEDGKLQHFDMKEIIKAEKDSKKKRGKKGPKGQETPTPTGADFEIDVSDPRFAALYSNHEFAIDPTKPNFKKTNNMSKLLDERRRRQDTGETERVEEPKNRKKRKTEKISAPSTVATKSDLMSLVEKVKRQAKNSQKEE